MIKVVFSRNVRRTMSVSLIKFVMAKNTFDQFSIKNNFLTEKRILSKVRKVPVQISLSLSNYRTFLYSFYHFRAK